MSGKTAIVTGSATGIGRAIALELARSGFRIVVNYTRSESEARATAEDVERAGSESMLVRADVSQDVECRRLVRSALEKGGRLNVLINNAGYTRAVPITDLESATEEDWDRTFAVNVKGAFFMTRACATPLRESRGCVVNVSSTAALNARGSSIAYCASKAALNNLTLSMARALAPQVRVNAVMPGYVETRWNERSYGERLGEIRKLVKQQSLLTNVASPQNIAQVVGSIVHGMEWVTGESIIVDGGSLARG